MLKLMKYEFRKTMFSKAILLVITAVAEAVFLVGLFCKWEDWLALGTIGLVFCAIIGISYIGIESLLVFQRDLNTKQSYMLFLTPRDSWQILGAKAIENGLSILLAGCFFAALAAIDISAAALYSGGVKQLLDVVTSLIENLQLGIDLSPGSLFLAFMQVLSVWFMTIVSGFLAIVLSATVLAGKKLSGLVSFAAFCLINIGTGVLIGHLPALSTATADSSLQIAVALALSALMYLISGWIMERKLSV